jgi:hypothetical protein
MKPYMKPGLQWEDPLDGKGPKKHRSHKKGFRQVLKKAIKQLMDPNNKDDPPKSGIDKIRLG